MTPDKAAPPKTTAGGGFVFEDKVVALLFSAMLVDHPICGADFGLNTKVHFQTQPDGWRYFDDFLLEFSSSRRIAFSIKSNAQITSGAVPAELVEAAWEHILRVHGACYDPSTDFFGLVLSNWSDEVRDAVTELTSRSVVADLDLLESRIAKPGWTNEVARKLFQSCACPQTLASTRDAPETRAGRLLSRLFPWRLDFESVSSQDEASAVRLCREALESGDTVEATALWSSLLTIAAKLRTKAGSLVRSDLLDSLRGNWRLRVAPEYRPDWGILGRYTTQLIDVVDDTVGSKVTLQRQSERDKLDTTIASSWGIVYAGDSGAGKSGALKQWIRALGPTSRVLWFDARSLQQDAASFESSLGLRHPLEDVLREVPEGRAILVVDGVERLIQDNHLRTLAMLLKALGPEGATSPWRAVMSCETSSVGRVLTALAKSAIKTGSWELVMVDRIDPTDLSPVWQAFPRTQRLQADPRLLRLFSNLKVLDLVARRSEFGDVDSSAWVGEGSVAGWFWEELIAAGTDGARRAKLVALLAELLADRLESVVSIHDEALQVADLGPLGGLEADRICHRNVEDQVFFMHELLGDWARLRKLISQPSKVVSYLAQRAESPSWHRAVRLYGLHLLLSSPTVDVFTPTLDSLIAAGNHDGADLLLESPIFGPDPLPLLERISSSLLRGDALRRFLCRFLVYGTLPDPKVTDLASQFGLDPEDVAVEYRVPFRTYWPAVLAFLHRHRGTVETLAPVAAARVAQLWLQHTKTGGELRAEAADLALAPIEPLLGDEVTRLDREERRHCFRAALLGAAERPDEVAALILRAARRSPGAVPGPTGSPSPRVEGWLEEHDPGPWALGPSGKVDDAFRSVIFEEPALLPLVDKRPAAVREAVLAALIKAPSGYARYQDAMSLHELEIEDVEPWLVSCPWQGPFLALLRANFDEGLGLVLDLVHFATDRWCEVGPAKRPGQPGELGYDLWLENEQRMAVGEPGPNGGLVVRVDRVDREYRGDGWVYGWSACAHNPPHAVVTALIALEQYFYLLVEEKAIDLDSQIRRALKESSSTAILRILCNVGKMRSELFAGSLAPLLSVPELYYWDAAAVRSEPAESVPSGFDEIAVLTSPGLSWAIPLARQFRSQAHRTADLMVLARDVYFEHTAVREIVGGFRNEWEARLQRRPEDPLQNTIANLINALDLRNYAPAKDQEGRELLVNVKAIERARSQREANEQDELAMFVLQLPMQCRVMLDERTPLPNEHVEGLWGQLNALHERLSQSHQGPLGGESEAVAGEPSATTSKRTERPSLRRNGPAALWRSLLGRVVGALAGGRALLARWIGQRTRFGNIRRQEPSESGNDEPAEDLLPSHAREKQKSGDKKDQERFARPALPQPLVERALSSIAAGLALIARTQGPWLESDATRREWAIDRLEEVADNALPLSGVDIPESVGGMHWDDFVSEAAVTLWLRDSDDPRLRALVARAVLAAPHHTAVAVVFLRCAERRREIARDFGQLRRILFERAHVSQRTIFLRFPGASRLTTRDLDTFHRQIDAWAQDRIEKFVASRLQTMERSWKAMDPMSGLDHFDEVRRSFQNGYFLDLPMVVKSHSWIPALSEALDEEDRKAILMYHREALGFVLGSASWVAPRSAEFPTAEGNHVLLNAGSLILDMVEAESPQDVCQSVLDAPPEHHQWVRAFLNGFHARALSSPSVPSAYLPILRAMVAYALENCTAWGAGESVWDALVGLDDTRPSWSDEHRELARDLWADLEEWFGRAPRHGSRVDALASWGHGPATAGLRSRCLVLVARRFLEDPDRADDRLIRKVAELVEIAWREEEQQIRSDSEAFSVFRSAVAWLQKRQNPIALDLARRIAGG